MYAFPLIPLSIGPLKDQERQGEGYNDRTSVAPSALVQHAARLSSDLPLDMTFPAYPDFILQDYS